MHSKPTASLLLITLTTGATMTGCSLSRTEKGAIVGAVAGAGAVIPFIVNELSKTAGAGRELPPARSRTTATESRGAPSL